MFGSKTKKAATDNPRNAESEIAAGIENIESTLNTDESKITFTSDNEKSDGLKLVNTGVLTKGTIIEGSLQTESDLQIDAVVKGDVTTKTQLVLGPNSKVYGNILAQNAEVAGEVKGNVQADGLLIIRSTSVIEGDVLTKDLNVESGATFNGRFQVGVSRLAQNATPKSAPKTTRKPDSVLDV